MTRKRTAPLVLLTAAALSMTACAQSERDSGSDGGTSGGDVKDTFTFGAAGAPDVFDPLYATDGETFRITRQIHSGLLGIKPGTADIQPELAESWTPSEDGLSWTFKLRQGVKFSNGKTLDADDILYSIGIHRTADTKSPAKSILAPIKEIKATSPSEIAVMLLSL